jgi:hypothetical protein
MDPRSPEPVEALCGVLAEETRACGALAAVLRDEQEAVVGLRPEALVACLGRRQLLHDELARLATRRRALLHDLAVARGAAAESVPAVLPLLAPGPQARVRAEVRSLRKALLEARGLERQNRRLVAGSLDTVEELLRALRALVPGARYGADARVAAPSPTERLHRRA